MTHTLKPLNINYTPLEQAIAELEAYTPPKKAEGNPTTTEEPPTPTAVPQIVTPITSLDDYLRLENLVCKDADGKIIEEYPELYVRKDVERNDQKQIMYFTPYDSVAHFEEKNNGEFQPSFALTCAIVANLYQNRSNPEADKVLKMYLSKGQNLSGYHTQNTLIDFGTEKIIHYPSETDFGQTIVVNSARTKRELPFSKSTLQHSLLQDALGNTASARYVQQLTGLSDPAILVAIGTYFDKPARLWFPWNGQYGAKYTDKHGAWFGCGGGDLYLDSISDLVNDLASRGVRR